MSNAKRLTKRDGEQLPGSLAWEIFEPLNIGQLDAEIVAEMNWRKPAGVLTEGLVDNATPEEPAILWVTHEGVKASVVTAVLKDHVPDDNWDHKPNPETANMTATELVARIDSGDPLTQSEVQAALRLVLAPLAEGEKTEGE